MNKLYKTTYEILLKGSKYAERLCSERMRKTCSRANKAIDEGDLDSAIEYWEKAVWSIRPIRNFFERRSQGLELELEDNQNGISC